MIDPAAALCKSSVAASDKMTPCDARTGKGDFRDKSLKHDPEKWIPVFRKGHAQSKS
jgi:hypothetical protein